MLQFLVLGPLEIKSGAIIRQVKGNTQAILLFALLLNQDRFTSAAELMEEVWGHGLPNKPSNALQVHMSKLRHLLRGLEPGQDIPWLISGASGYRLLPGGIDKFDGREFAETMARDMSSLLPRRRAGQLRSTLGKWRGPVLGGITGGAICQAGARHYEMLRLTAYQMLFDAELELGDHAAVISEISELAAMDSPFQEQFCEQKVIALCRAGRHADALEVCRGTWYQLVLDGAGSSRSLRCYERAILCHDPMLNAPHARLMIA
jgi:DNA-binding SARP family transcriptional activator